MANITPEVTQPPEIGAALEQVLFYKLSAASNRGVSVVLLYIVESMESS
jgi:hypothetical protein